LEEWKMKLSMRVVVSILAMFLVIFASSASWAATYNIVPVVKLNSTGTRMDLKLTYQKDGVNDPIANIFTNTQREMLGKEPLSFSITLVKNGSETEYVAERPVTMREDGLDAVFMFDTPLEDGDYTFSHAGINGDDVPDAELEAFMQELLSMGTATQEQLETYDQAYSYDTEPIGSKINGGQPVSIKREATTNDNDSGGGSGGGCNTGFGIVGLLFVGLMTLKSRKERM
jgi:hypothetical protein